MSYEIKCPHCGTLLTLTGKKGDPTIVAQVAKVPEPTTPKSSDDDPFTMIFGKA